MATLSKLSIRKDIHAALKARSKATGIPMVRIIGALLNAPHGSPQAPQTAIQSQAPQASIHDTLLKVVAAHPDADTVMAVSHILRRLPS